MKGERLRRVEPKRTGPIRNPLIAVRPDGARSSDAGEVAATVMEQGLKTARRVAEATNETVAGAVERGVETAYMVVEEYMERGRHAAAYQRKRRNGGKQMSDNQQDYWGMWGPMAPMMAPWMQMMGMWANAMSPFGPGGPPGTQWMNQFWPGGPGGCASSRAEVSVWLESEKPARVTVNLGSVPEYTHLTVDTGSNIETRIEWQSGRPCVSVKVPAEQPDACYRGTIRDQYGNGHGELIVAIGVPE